MAESCVTDLVSPICVDPNDGAVQCLRARDAICRGKQVTLNFAGVLALTSSFLNSAIGCLVGDFPSEMIQNCLFWCGLDKGDEELVNLVVKNAQRFYAATPAAREAIVAASTAAVAD
jgi:STAS-like domain of unknown function (DUF4325)